MKHNLADLLPCIDPSGRGLARLRTKVPALLVASAMLMTAGTPKAAAQANVSFRSGLTGLYNDDKKFDWGTNVGIVAKFNVTPLFRIRSQIDLDRVGMSRIALGDYVGPHTATFTSIGFGSELELGGNDIDVVAQVTPMMVIRTSTRVASDGLGGERIWDITRFSLGVTTGIGGEWFISDNIGLETQVQYVLFNFDHDDVDPRYSGLRLDLGVQFYLGKTFDK